MTAISDFFRTALLIDDCIENDRQDSGEDPQIEDVDSGEDIDSGLGEPVPSLVLPDTDGQTPIFAVDLVRAFLAENIVCSILKPPDDTNEFMKLARRGASIADLLIIDWRIFDDDSATTIEAIHAISESRQDRLTVIVIFSGVQRLISISDRLIEEANFEQVYEDMSNEFVLKLNDTVVLLFGKPEVARAGHEKDRIATYSELPGMIRADLEMVFKGLMPEFAFRGINTLRESTPRILATFNSDLDGAALVHRALLPEPTDAGPQFVKLLASDFEQALHDERVGEVWDHESVREHLEVAPPGGSLRQLTAKLKSHPGVADEFTALDAPDLAREAIARGLSGIGMGDSAVSRAVGDLVAAVGGGPANESLAILMSSSSIGATRPRLELGVVLRGQHGDYWLCIQPLCDSVRLDESRAFPLLRISLDAKKPAAMIRSPEGDAIRIGFDSSPHRLAMPQFAPTHQRAVLAHGDSSNWRFTSEDGAEYRAITRLRPEVAAQAVHGLASAASRTGADVSEWLRRGAPS